jgi:hypothetical protein
MRGRLDAREIEDIGDSALTFQEVKALATGNPLLLDQAQAQADVARLERLERAHDRGQADLRRSLRSHQAELRGLGDVLAAAQAAIASRRDTRGDAFAMVVAGRPLSMAPKPTPGSAWPCWRFSGTRHGPIDARSRSGAWAPKTSGPAPGSPRPTLATARGADHALRTGARPVGRPPLTSIWCSAVQTAHRMTSTPSRSDSSARPTTARA